MDWEEIGQKISDFGKEVGGKVKDTAEILCLKQKLASEESKLKAAYRAIGELYYQEHEGEIEDAYIVHFEHVGEANAAIEDYQAQINNLKGVQVCPSCGASVEAGAAYCGKCGHRMN